MKDGRDETFEADAVDEYDQAPDHEDRGVGARISENY